MKIYKSRFYICKATKGISGFQRFGYYDTYLVNGYSAKVGKGFYASIEELNDNDYKDRKFELLDGHLPGYCPIGNLEEAKEYVLNTGKCRLIEG